MGLFPEEKRAMQVAPPAAEGEVLNGDVLQAVSMGSPWVLHRLRLNGLGAALLGSAWALTWLTSCSDFIFPCHSALAGQPHAVPSTETNAIKQKITVANKAKDEYDTMPHSTSMTIPALKNLQRHV